MKSISRLLLGCLLISLFTIVSCQLFSPSAADKVLRYKYETGKPYSYNVIVETKTSGQAMGQEFTATVVNDFQFTLQVTEKSADQLTFKATIDKFLTRIDVPLMGMNDSTIEMKNFIGKRFEVVMTTRGKTLSVTPLDSIPPTRGMQMMQSNPADLFQRIFVELPEQEAPLQSTWKTTKSDTIMRSGIRIITKPEINFIITAEEQHAGYKCRKIEFNGKSTMEGTGTVQGLEVTVDGTMMLKGTMFVATKEGILTGGEQSTDMDMTQTFSGQQTGAQSMTTVMTSKINLLTK